jgi:ABC-2 type transport system ATP-binding protein
MMESVITARGLTRRFGGKVVLDRLDLEVPQGAIYALLGDNGAGKSTAIRILTGQLPAHGGHAQVMGLDCFRHAIPLRHRIGYVPEKPRFYDWMTVREIGWFSAGFHLPGYYERYLELVARFQLDPTARLKSLSKGGYARVGLALALAGDPEVLILDEPTSGLDLFTRKEFLSSMVELAGDGRTILISSHNISEVERVASHAAFLAHGRLLLAGPLEDLRQRMVRVCLQADGTPPDPSGLGQVLDVELAAREWRAVVLDPDPVALEDLAHRPGVLACEQGPLSLEEMYTALLARFHRPSVNGAPPTVTDRRQAVVTPEPRGARP